MITPFGLRHIGQVRDLAASCTVLDPAAVGTSSSGDPLLRALRGYFVRNSGKFTYVLRAVDGSTLWRGFVQAEKEPGASAWRVVCLAPRIPDCPYAPTVWYRLLLHLFIAAGERHVQKLFACVEQDGSEEQILRQANFALYCHDSVWLLSKDSSLRCGPTERVRAARPEDAWGIQRLCTKVAPRPVREAEGLVENGSGGEPPGSLELPGQLVLVGRQADVAGWAAVSHDGSAYWLRLAVSPEERDGAAELVQCALAAIPAAGPRKVLCAVRDYEGGMAAVLDQSGFEPMVERSLLVKQTTVQVSESRRKLVTTLEKRAGVVPTTSRCEGAPATLAESAAVS